MKRLIQILTIFCMLFLVAGCLKLDKKTEQPEETSEEGLSILDVPTDQPEEPEENLIKPANFTTKYNLPDHDVFSEKEWTSLDVSVMGIKLGDSKEKVIELMGEPDSMRNYEGYNIYNYEYKQKLGLDKVGLLFNIKDNEVNRITLKIVMNKYLKGETQIKHRKADLYKMFGQPSEIRILSTLTVYMYNSKGLEIIMDGPYQNGFSITWPKEEPDYVKSSVKNESLIQE